MAAQDRRSRRPRRRSPPRCRRRRRRPRATPTIPPLPKPTVTKGVGHPDLARGSDRERHRQDVTVVAVLRDRAGGRIAAQHLSLFLDGGADPSAMTDAHGTISFTILGKKLDQAGDYSVGVLFGGSHGWAGSTANGHAHHPQRRHPDPDGPAAARPEVHPRIRRPPSPDRTAWRRCPCRRSAATS